MFGLFEIVRLILSEIISFPFGVHSRIGFLSAIKPFSHLGFHMFFHVVHNGFHGGGFMVEYTSVAQVLQADLSVFKVC